VDAISIGNLLLAGVALLISMGTLIARLWHRDDRDQFERRLSEQALAVQELTDKMVHWMQKENARRAREGKDKSEGSTSQVPIDGASKKAQLRARARQMGLN